MGVAGGSLSLGVAQELADHRQTLADQQTAAGKGVPQVVDAHVVEARRGLGCVAMGVAEVREMASGALANFCGS